MNSKERDAVLKCGAKLEQKEHPWATPTLALRIMDSSANISGISYDDVKKIFSGIQHRSISSKKRR